MRPRQTLIICFLSCLLLAGCIDFGRHDGAPSGPVDVSHVKNAVPHYEPLSPYGNPASYSVLGHRYQVLHTAAGYDKVGDASWYGTKFHGQLTSTREPYNMLAMTAAHKTLPIPCYAKVTNLKNGRSVIVRINDRGPFHQGRIIDLSYAAAKKLSITHYGTAKVRVQAIDPRAPSVKPQHWWSTHPSKVPKTKLYVQIAAYGELANARKQLDHIHLKTREQGIIRREHVNGQTLYRVYMGPYGNDWAVRQTQEKLADLGIRHTLSKRLPA